jgi:hypothetical protein
MKEILQNKTPDKKELMRVGNRELLQGTFEALDEQNKCLMSVRTMF